MVLLSWMAIRRALQLINCVTVSLKSVCLFVCFVNSGCYFTDQSNLLGHPERRHQLRFRQILGMKTGTSLL